MKHFLKVLNQYADFKGRASRSEYWLFVLVNTLITLAFCALGFGLWMWTEKDGAVFLPCIYLMATLIPSWAVAVRRLHDSNQSAWFISVNLIPVVGTIWFFIVLTLQGDPDVNRYGNSDAGTRYHRTRSAAVALMLSSVLWLLIFISLFIFLPDINNQQLFSILMPVGLFITGVLLFSKRMFSVGVAWSLIVFSVIWLILSVFAIKTIYPELVENFNISLIIGQFSVLVPLGLLLSGIYILLKITDRTVPACMLFVGSFVWILSDILNITQASLSFNNVFAFLSLFSNLITVVVAASILVFARTLLSKEKSGKEQINQPEATMQSVAQNPVSSQQVEEPEALIDQKPPITQPKKEPIIQPEAVIAPNPVSSQQVEEPKKEPEAVIVPNPVQEPVKQQEAVIVPNPVRSQPDTRRNVVFLREDKDANNIWIVYKAPSKVHAMSFLSKVRIDKPSYYVIVETPEGNFGRDKDGLYQE